MVGAARRAALPPLHQKAGRFPANALGCAFSMKVSDLRGILTYIPGFREKTFVIALDGSVIADDNFSNILLDIAVLRSLSIRIVIVHGAAHQMQELSEEA